MSDQHESSDAIRPDTLVPPPPPPPPPPANPVTGAERIETLDLLRGFAVLGILVMNIGAYAQVGAAYMNPLALGLPNTVDWIVWTTNHLLADFKFMTLFSVLFGAGIMLFATRVEARGHKPAGLHYRRMFWLWLIGMVHGYIFWWGDILVAYATCGAIVFLFRKLRPRTLVIVAVLMILGPSLLLAGFGLGLDKLPEEIGEEVRTETAAGWSPSEEAIAEETEAYRGNWLEQMPQRAKSTAESQFGAFFFVTGPRVTALMLIGMALFKLGVITGAASRRIYKLMMAVGWLVGFTLVVMGVFYNHSVSFIWNKSMLFGIQFNYWGSLFVAAGYLGMIAMWVKSGGLPALRERLGAVGRMAFTNYLMHTLVFTTVFYGHGLGLFGSVGRWQQAVLVVVMFGLQLWLSPIWLKHFRFGPMEWVWRSLTYWQRQPMRRV